MDLSLYCPGPHRVLKERIGGANATDRSAVDPNAAPLRSPRLSISVSFGSGIHLSILTAGGGQSFATPNSEMSLCLQAPIACYCPLTEFRNTHTAPASRSMAWWIVTIHFRLVCAISKNSWLHQSIDMGLMRAGASLSSDLLRYCKNGTATTFIFKTGSRKV